MQAFYRWVIPALFSLVLLPMASFAHAQEPVPSSADTVPAIVPADPSLEAEPEVRPELADTIPAPEPTRPDSLSSESFAPDPFATEILSGDTLFADTIPARPPLSAAADSVLRLLRELEGFTITEYVGENARYSVETGVLRLEGGAEVARDGDRLTADTIVYREGRDLIEAYGSPRVLGQGQELEGDSLFYDLSTRRAVALGARTEVTEMATWYVTGDMTLEGTDRLFGSHAQFTSCDLAIPHYHFEADKVMVLRDHILVARPARLYFGDVPVMVLPFVVQNLETGRRSGFLTPRFGVHDIVRASSGYNRQISDVGFYWAMNQYMGAQLSTTWRSGAYTALLGTVDFNWRQQFLNGNLGLERYWRETGGRELSINARSAWQPDERTNLSLTGRYASSADFVRDASYDPREVTQDLASSLSLNRRFSWGSTSLGAERRQSIATGDVSMTLPSFSISLPSKTFFRAPTPEQQRWFSNTTFTPGGITGSRSSNSYANVAGRALRQDQEVTRLNVSPSFSVGNFSVSTTASLNRAELMAATGVDRDGETVTLPGFNRDEGRWTASASYRQSLIGSTNISPNINLEQQVMRDSVTANEYLLAPMRVSFGAGLNTDLYGFFPGVGPFTTIRHRLSPRFSYGYAPEVRQTELQEEVFGMQAGRARNRISLTIDQSWEAKLRNPPPPPEPEMQDSIAGDTIPQARQRPIPNDPEKVTILSLSTSALEYDFVQAADEGTGFVTDRISNSIRSDYLRGLTVQVQHELFDRRDLDPRDSRGQLGTFAPRLSSLSTSFELGPQTALFQWLGRLATGRDAGEPEESGADAGVLPGEPESDEPAVAGQGPATGNPQGTGRGPWRVGLGYQFSRPPRTFSSGMALDDDPFQSLDANMSFQLSPNWGVDWSTSYSITDNKFGSHRLNFVRDLHEWRANFSFYQTPNGNSAFEFYVELLHNRDLRFDYSEPNLGIDRRR